MSILINVIGSIFYNNPEFYKEVFGKSSSEPWFQLETALIVVNIFVLSCIFTFFLESVLEKKFRAFSTRAVSSAVSAAVLRIQDKLSHEQSALLRHIHFGNSSASTHDVGVKVAHRNLGDGVMHVPDRHSDIAHGLSERFSAAHCDLTALADNGEQSTDRVGLRVFCDAAMKVLGNTDTAIAVEAVYLMLCAIDTTDEDDADDVGNESAQTLSLQVVSFSSRLAISPISLGHSPCLSDIGHAYGCICAADL
jgi:hypothetical protein